VPTAGRLENIERKAAKRFTDVISKTYCCIINSTESRCPEQFNVAETVILADVSRNGSEQVVTEAKGTLHK
jgi:hypothetical protein